MPRGTFFAYRSFQPELDTVRAFADRGIDTICLTSANTLNSQSRPARGRGEFAPLLTNSRRSNCSRVSGSLTRQIDRF